MLQNDNEWKLHSMHCQAVSDLDTASPFEKKYKRNEYTLRVSLEKNIPGSFSIQVTHSSCPVVCDAYYWNVHMENGIMEKSKQTLK